MATNTIIQGQVGAPSNISLGDGTTPNALMGKSAELIESQLHGKYYTAAYRKMVFVGTTLIAGVTLPVNTTTAPTFTLFNPASSGVNIELLSLDIAWPAAATTVVGSLLGSLSFQTPTATTSGGNIFQMPFNGTPGGSKAALYTAATIVATTYHTALLNITSTADAMTASHYDWDGRLILAPGNLFTLFSSPVQTGVALPSLYWAEFPV